MDARRPQGGGDANVDPRSSPPENYNKIAMLGGFYNFFYSCWGAFFLCAGLFATVFFLFGRGERGSIYVGTVFILNNWDILGLLPTLYENVHRPPCIGPHVW